MIEKWRVHYNTIRPHNALGYRAGKHRDSGPEADGALSVYLDHPRGHAKVVLGRGMRPAIYTNQQ